MKAPLWWKQLWCPHNDTLKGTFLDGETWEHCNTCGRRMSGPKREKVDKPKQPFWKPPNFK